MAGPTTTNAIELSAYRQKTLVLLEQQKTLVLAVNADDGPWVAPVYYVFHFPGIYFFSSPTSRHIQAIRDDRWTAGAIFSDSDRWQDINGVQMIGHVNEVRGKLERLNITASYLAKFPPARDFFMSGGGKIGDLGQKVGLYVFQPIRIHCTNNRLGFGRRVEIALDSLGVTGKKK